MTDLIAEFNGFDTPQENWSKLPHALIDLLPLFPGGTELKVVLYILRHTWGYQEYDDAKKITMDEFMRGRKRRDGSRIDNGVGMSEPAIRKALVDAEAHGLIVIEIDDHDKARIEKHYCIRKSGVKHLPPEGKTFTLGTKESLPRTEKDTLGKKLEERKDTPNGGSQPLSKEKRNGKPSKEEAIADTTHGITPRRDLHDVTERMLGLKSAAYPLIEKWVNFLTGNTPEYTTARKGEKTRRNGVWHEYQIQPGMEAAEIGAFGRWYRSVHPGIDVPSKCDSMNLHVARFRAASDHARMVEAYRRDLEVQAIRAAQPAPIPSPVDDEPITDEQRAAAAEMFEALTAKLGGQ